ncbi:kinase-like domain-containing protein, partial [Tribonema minus]
MEKYRRIEELGRGAFGCATLVTNGAGERCVVKEISLGHLAPREREAAEREAQLLRQMHHSNIVSYIESFVEDSSLYIVMDYADGGDLASAIAARRAPPRRPFAEGEVMRVFAQVCLALRHVHALNILHRDLKAPNIFLTARGVVKLGDFGVARALEASTGGACARTQIGTPHYLSPEICQDQPYGKKSDMWALGVVLYEMFALRVPFQAGNLPALANKIVSEDPPPIPDCYSADGCALVAQLLAKAPRQRPSVGQVLRGVYLQAHIAKLLAHAARTG